jgi:hypothetical protein
MGLLLCLSFRMNLGQQEIAILLLQKYVTLEKITAYLLFYHIEGDTPLLIIYKYFSYLGWGIFQCHFDKEGGIEHSARYGT